MLSLCVLVICCVCSIRIDRRRHPHRPVQTSASTDADIRIDRRRRPHRPAQTSASIDADCISMKKRPSKVVVHLLGLYVLYIKK